MKSISKSTTNIQSNFNMQVENNIQSKSSPCESENSPPKQIVGSESKQSRAQNRIARYEQKPERKASKMLVRLLQWADKLVIKFFTKKFLPSELQIFFNREARANKVQLKKAQIDYSVQDFAVRLYVFWVCRTYFQKNLYQQSLAKLLLELRDELTRKKKNLAESLQTCEQQSEKKQKEEELKWMGAIINGLNTFVHRYKELSSEDQTLQFLLQITSNIMIDCLRKPGNKLGKKKEKLKIKIKYFQSKIADILGNHEQKMIFQDKQKKVGKVIQKTTIIISPGHTPFEGLARTISNSSAFQKYKGQQELHKQDRTVSKVQVAKKQDFQVKLQYPKKSESIFKSQQIQKSEQRINTFQKIKCQTLPTSQVKMQEQIAQSSVHISSYCSQNEQSIDDQQIL